MFALVCYLVANLSPGGMISPGWLALTLVQDWRQFLAVVAAVLATWGGALLLQRWVILFGRRLLAATVLLGVLLATGAFLVVQNTVPLLRRAGSVGLAGRNRSLITVKWSRSARCLRARAARDFD